ncbi:hypothetical protein [Nocardioides panacisoli]|uniref:hypothetical protein n=1 Tax=Nocardioides panacisoli TaxID=627624 RepID=UPI0031E15625
MTKMRTGLLGLAAAVLSLTFLVGAVVAPAHAADVDAKRGTPPARSATISTPDPSTPRTADRSSAQVLVAGGALVLIGAGIGAGVVRARRHPELVTYGH